MRNTYQSGQWGDEERNGGSPLKAGCDFTLYIVCEERGYKIYINDNEYTFYSNRIPPQSITHLRIKGLLTLCSIMYKSTSVSRILLWWFSFYYAARVERYRHNLLTFYPCILHRWLLSLARCFGDKLVGIWRKLRHVPWELLGALATIAPLGYTLVVGEAPFSKVYCQFLP